MIRNPAVAGQFYPASAKELKKMIAQFVDPTAVKEELIGALIPHAGYPYSGPVAGATFSRIEFGDTFIIIGPSHTGMGKPLSIMAEGIWKTPLGDVPVDAELARKILENSKYLQEDTLAHQSEHCVEVQLPFLQYFKSDVKIVPIVLSYAAVDVYQEIGQEIAAAIKSYGKKVVIVASGDMTHYEPQETAYTKDMYAIEAMLDLDEEELSRRVEKLDISMCAHFPAVVLISAAREMGATRAELVRYQTSGDTTGDYSAVVGYAGVIVGKSSPLVQLARQTVETFVNEGRIIKPGKLTPEMKEQAGVFVSIKKKGELRGCIGTFESTTENVAYEVISNAIGSASRDPRFLPISPNELKDLSYSVDVLTMPESVKSADQLDPKKYGLIVECGWRRGLLLPDLEGVDTVDEQIDICRRKAGIEPDEPVKLYRFEVKRYR